MRVQYQQQLDNVLSELVEMTGGVRAALSQATDALLHADLSAAELVISGDLAIDEARERIENDSFEILARQAPVAGDLRMLVASLRMVADLERMGDLSVHVAKVARLRYPTKAVPAVLEPVIAEMAKTADEMIAAAAEIVETRDVHAAQELEESDDQMDRLRQSMFRTLLSDDWSEGVEPAVDMALLGRYYERIGDHAVSMARRIVFLVTGQHPACRLTTLFVTRGLGGSLPPEPFAVHRKAWPRVARMTETSYRLLLVRHGESDWNAKNLFTGWVDVALSGKGRDEAVRAGVAHRRARHAARRPAHVRAAACDRHRSALPRRDRPALDPRAALLAAQRTALRRPAGQGQEGDSRGVRRGAVHALAPVVRHAAARARRRRRVQPGRRPALRVIARRAAAAHRVPGRRRTPDAALLVRRRGARPAQPVTP